MYPCMWICSCQNQFFPIFITETSCLWAWKVLNKYICISCKQVYVDNIFVYNISRQMVTQPEPFSSALLPIACSND